MNKKPNLNRKPESIEDDQVLSMQRSEKNYKDIKKIKKEIKDLNNKHYEHSINIDNLSESLYLKNNKIPRILRLTTKKQRIIFLLMAAAATVKYILS